MIRVLDALERDWVQLGRDPDAAVELAEVLALAGVADLAALERWARVAPPAEVDRVLLGLVTAAVAGSALAARVVLHLLLPGVRSLIRRDGRDRDERAAAVLAAVCARIRRYPVAARPGRVAANILLDAAQELTRRARRDQRAVPWDWQYVEGDRLPVALHHHGPGHEPAHGAELLSEALGDAVEAGTISATDAEMIAATRIAGRSLHGYAARHGVTVRAMQLRRRRAETALAGTGLAA